MLNLIYTVIVVSAVTPNVFAISLDGEIAEGYLPFSRQYVDSRGRFRINLDGGFEVKWGKSALRVATWDEAIVLAVRAMGQGQTPTIIAH